MKKRTVVDISRPPEVNVTPLIDVVLVLLIIFMVVSPLVAERLGTELAESATEPVAAADPSQILVRVEQDGALVIDNAAVPAERYVDVLREKLSAHAPGGKVVFLDAHEKAGYARLVTALDGAKQAGAASLGIVMPPP